MIGYEAGVDVEDVTDHDEDDISDIGDGILTATTRNNGKVDRKVRKN